MMKMHAWLALAGIAFFPACAPVEAPQTGTSLGLTWRVSSVNGGAQAVLFEADGRRSALISCQNGLLSVEIPTFRPVIGPAPVPAYLHLGGQPVALSQAGEGRTATGRPPADIAERILTANEFRFTLGDQVFGPYMPPTGSEAQLLANACREAASFQPRGR